MRLGIDVGGTFTDIIAVDDKSGQIFVTKTYTTPKNFSQGVIDAIEKLKTSTQKSDFDVLIHGTTIGTNALIEKKGAKTGLLTTEGFRDVLEIGRFQRPAEGLYDFNVDNPPPLVPRFLRLEATERIGSKGEVVIPIDEESVRKSASVFKNENVESIAISFLFSFLNPSHEKIAKKILEDELPGRYISLSSEICSEFREYERTSTVVISAYLQPIVEKYVEDLKKRIDEKYSGMVLRLIQANGGTMNAESVKGKAVYLVNSGPAGGATAAYYLGNLIKRDKLISMDMGGTSFDVCLLEKGATHTTTDVKFDGYPIKISMEEVSIIGAGGGSIAWIDKGGALNVGPQSAAAEPGPACYNKGGTEPTVTDANVVLGRISPDYFLGGEIKLHQELSHKVIKEKLCSQLKISLEDAAYGIIRVVNANMAKAITVRSTQRGYDLREFSLVAFGGAGPLHAVEIAEELGIKEIIIPPYPGAFSAFGLLVADAQHNYVRTIMKSEEQLDLHSLLQVFHQLENEGVEQLKDENFPPNKRQILWSLDLRYEGQSYELNIPIKRQKFTKKNVKNIISHFNKKHEQVYSFKGIDEKVVFVNARVTAIGISPKIKIKKIKMGSKNPSSAFKGKRKVFFYAKGFVNTNIFERDLLKAGNVVNGPAIIEEKISCTIVTPDRIAYIDDFGNILIR